jgi:hypothetical protein
MKQPATIRTIIEVIFDGLGDAGEREGNRFVVASGYGSGATVIDVQDVAVALLERFEIAEHEGPGDGN